MDQDDGGWDGLRRSPDSLALRLTPQQGRLLTLLARGRTDTEIARALGLTRGEALSAKRLAFRDAGISRRAQAVLWARVTGGGR